MKIDIKSVALEDAFTFEVLDEVITIRARQVTGEKAYLFDQMTKGETTRELKFEGELADSLRIKVDLPTDMETRAIAVWLSLLECSFKYSDTGEPIFTKDMPYAEFRARFYNPGFIVRLEGGGTLDLRDLLCHAVAALNPDWFPDVERRRLQQLPDNIS